MSDLEPRDQQALTNRLAQDRLELAKRQLALSGRRLALLIAVPPVAGGLLLLYLVIAWSVDYIEPSGTTSTAMVVAAALILVPAALAALRGTTSDEHTDEVFDAFQDFLRPPEELSPPTTAELPR